MAAVDPFDLVARAFEAKAGRRRRDKWATPGVMARQFDPHTVQTPALDLIDAAIVETLDTPDGRLIITMPPQEGKTERVGRRTPAWQLHRDPNTRVGLASKEKSLARRTARQCRDDIMRHGAELGIRVRRDVSAQSEWSLDGYRGGMIAVGIGSMFTGRAIDMLIIDDVIANREQADSEIHRQKVWDWWLEVARPRLAPGAPVIIILTRWHEDDIVGRLLAAEDGDVWRVLHIPAEADHDPAKGEADVLGRQPGEFMVSARGRTVGQWQAIKRGESARAWNALYQGRPGATEGNYFKREWWREYRDPRWVVDATGRHIVVNPDEVCQSWDMAFKKLDDTDYVVGQVWARWGLDVYLLDQVRARMSFVETRKAVRTLTAKWPGAVAKYIEDKANGPAVINSLQRTVAGLIPVEPAGGKESRAAAVSPFVEAGSVFLPSPELAPWVGEFIEELATFPRARNDDQVDAMTQALNRLLLLRILDGSLIVEADDLDAELAEFTISPY